jgi:predicted transcriptional regulator YdeE
MSTTTISSFSIIGISVRTTNENGQAAKDIPALWGKFIGENLIPTIPNISNNNIHCIYTDYEDDHTKPYTVLLGMKVSSLETIPNGMVGMSFSGGDYQTFECSGNLETSIVYQTWEKIWNEPIDRAYTADIEVYDASKPDPKDSAVTIHIALK